MALPCKVSPQKVTHAGHPCVILTASKNWRPILPWYVSELSHNVQRLESFLALDQKMILCLSLYIVKYKDKALKGSKDDFMPLIIHCKVQGQSTQGIICLSWFKVAGFYILKNSKKNLCGILYKYGEHFLVRYIAFWSAVQ